MEDFLNQQSSEPTIPPTPEPMNLWGRMKRLFIGPPRDLEDRSLYHRISLVAFLAWIGLGADGLSSSTYGPEEAFRALGEHTYLAIGLAGLVATTVLIISSAYSRIIEEFPRGGGGYVVATKLLGSHAGVVSGSALFVDYVLTITISIAAAGDALFSLLPLPWHAWKLPLEIFVIAGLSILNMRGVKESVIILTPIFLLFLGTHIVLIGGGILAHGSQLPAAIESARAGFSSGLTTVGATGLFLLFIHAYSLGGGTYTGIEAVSNGLTIMREPRVRTARRTMLYMGVSLALTAAGLLFCYLLWEVPSVPGKTMNAVLVERFVEAVPLGSVFVIVTLISEGALLVVASQTGFVDGPRVLANMAVDSWMPRRFSALSDRLTAQNGILLMGLAALLALLYTKGDVRHIVLMYSINVFLTFSLSMLGMVRHSYRSRRGGRPWIRWLILFAVGFILCSTILAMTLYGKFGQGGWVTLAVTGSVILLSYLIRRHYDTVYERLRKLYAMLMDVPTVSRGKPPVLDPAQPVAAILVASYGGLGLHTFLNAFRNFPNHFKGAVFVSVGVIDSGAFKGEGTVDAQKANVEENLRKYVDFARGQGIPADYRFSIGTDAVEEAERLCLEVAREFRQVMFFAGKVFFRKEKWYQNILHNETAYSLQKRLHGSGRMLIIIPALVT